MLIVALSTQLVHICGDASDLDLKFSGPKGRAGSSPALGTVFSMTYRVYVLSRCFAFDFVDYHEWFELFRKLGERFRRRDSLGHPFAVENQNDDRISSRARYTKSGHRRDTGMAGGFNSGGPGIPLILVAPSQQE